MLIVMRKDAGREQIDAVISAIGEKGYEARPIPGETGYP